MRAILTEQLLPILVVTLPVLKILKTPFLYEDVPDNLEVGHDVVEMARLGKQSTAF